jgi:hypothetical protein
VNNTLIANVAKQSSAVDACLDCFVALLFAMTLTASRQRGSRFLVKNTIIFIELTFIEETLPKSKTKKPLYHRVQG